jgi:hypothetical protein
MVLKLEADSILQQKEQQKDISIKNCTTAEQVLWMMQLHYCTIALLHYCTIALKTFLWKYFATEMQ